MVYSCVGIHWRSLLMNYFLLLQQCSVLTWIVYEMGCKWPYSQCFQDLFKTVCSILVEFSPSFFSRHFIWVQREDEANTSSIYFSPNTHTYITIHITIYRLREWERERERERERKRVQYWKIKRLITYNTEFHDSNNQVKFVNINTLCLKTLRLQLNMKTSIV